MNSKLLYCAVSSGIFSNQLLYPNLNNLYKVPMIRIELVFLMNLEPHHFVV